MQAQNSLPVQEISLAMKPNMSRDLMTIFLPNLKRFSPYKGLRAVDVLIKTLSQEGHYIWLRLSKVHVTTFIGPPPKAFTVFLRYVKVLLF